MCKTCSSCFLHTLLLLLFLRLTCLIRIVPFIAKYSFVVDIPLSLSSILMLDFIHIYIVGVTFLKLEYNDPCESPSYRVLHTCCPGHGIFWYLIYISTFIGTSMNIYSNSFIKIITASDTPKVTKIWIRRRRPLRLSLYFRCILHLFWFIFAIGTKYNVKYGTYGVCMELIIFLNSTAEL